MFKFLVYEVHVLTPLEFWRVACVAGEAAPQAPCSGVLLPVSV
jgi:hypothetical protein